MDECRQTPGTSHFWCNTINNGVGFCTPGHLLEKLRVNISEEEEDLHYDLFDPSLIQPRGGSIPISFGVEQDKEGPADTQRSEELKSFENDPNRADIIHPEANFIDGEDVVVTEPSQDVLSSFVPFYRQHSTATTTAATPVALETSPPAIAYTAYGEACLDECSKHGDIDIGYTWCRKQERSNVGTWSDADYCSVDAGVTSHGEDCVDECAQRGYQYYWCHKTTTLWGFCTPAHLIIKK